MTTPGVTARAEKMKRRSVAEWIRRKPVMIALQRPSRTPDGVGGYAAGPSTTLLEQQFRLTVFRRRINHQSAPTAEGDIVSLSYVLTGAYNADVRPGDYFTYDGTSYSVSSIQVDRSVRTACELAVTSVNGYG